ncbi:hypothetical protein Zmor_023343 [Zophobas morio]|uniref:Uncharacterized protein n=1 Tax=Zophobas morio TaxID=2755281 RepID=A0AA38HWR2_9CUCU|nr:hypothetical protein Zmor_023343 [Zophobas morio]
MVLYETYLDKVDLLLRYETLRSILLKTEENLQMFVRQLALNSNTDYTLLANCLKKYYPHKVYFNHDLNEDNPTDAEFAKSLCYLVMESSVF